MLKPPINLYMCCNLMGVGNFVDVDFATYFCDFLWDITYLYKLNNKPHKTQLLYYNVFIQDSFSWLPHFLHIKVPFESQFPQ